MRSVLFQLLEMSRRHCERPKGAKQSQNRDCFIAGVPRNDKLLPEAKLILCLIIICLIFIGCAKKQTNIEQKAKAGPEQQVLKFTLAGYGQGQKREWQIEGDSADIEQDTVSLQDIKAQTYGKDTNFILTADKGQFDKIANTAKLTENVNAVVDDQKRQAKTTITCSGPLEIDYRNNFATFNDNVKVQDKQGTITSDKATIYFDSTSKKLVRILMNGNVHITQGVNESFCDEASYETSECKITLSGRPRVLISSENGKIQGMDNLFK